MIQQSLQAPSTTNFTNTQVALVKAFPVVLNVAADSKWNITAYPGTHMLAKGRKEEHINVEVVPMKEAPISRVAPHGLIGQSYLDHFSIGGKLDQYMPDANGEFSTSAQAEG